MSIVPANSNIFTQAGLDGLEGGGDLGRLLGGIKPYEVGMEVMRCWLRLGT